MNIMTLQIWTQCGLGALKKGIMSVRGHYSTFQGFIVSMDRLYILGRNDMPIHCICRSYPLSSGASNEKFCLHFKTPTRHFKILKRTASFFREEVTQKSPRDRTGAQLSKCHCDNIFFCFILDQYSQQTLRAIFVSDKKLTWSSQS